MSEPIKAYPLHNVMGQYVKLIVRKPCCVVSYYEWDLRATKEKSDEFNNRISKACKASNYTINDLINAEDLILEFDTEDAAVDFCNDTPDSSPYIVVYNKSGEVIHENT